MANTTLREQIFFSYSHKDKKWLELFRAALKPLIRANQFSVWDDTRIKAGDLWRDEIRQALASAKVAVLLVSMNFYNSDFIAENELPPLLEAAQNEGLNILLVIVGHSLLDETELGRYQAVNDPSKPLATMTAASREKEIVRICKEIIAAVTPAEGVQSVAPTASGKSTLKSRAARIEELAGRVKELERENAALEKAREDASNLYEKARRENDAIQMSLTSKIHDLESNKWLHELATRDKSNVSRYVYIIFDRIDYEGLTELSSYIEIIFYIINASVYNITINKNIEDGAVYLNGVELNPKQAKIDGSLKYISRDNRGEKRLLAIKQWLTPTEVERIRNPHRNDKLHFNRLKLIVSGADDSQGVLPQRLSLPSSVPADYTSRPNELSIIWYERMCKIEELTRILGMFYLATNQLEQREIVSQETAKNLMGSYANALQNCFDDLKIVEEYLDNVPPFPDSVNEQKEWVDSQRFKLRSLIDEQRNKLMVYVEYT